MHEVYLCTDRTASHAVGIRAMTIVSMRVADQCHGYHIENPAHRKGFLPVHKAFVTAFELIISSTDRAGESMAVFKRNTEPIRVFAIVMLPFLCDCRCGEKQCNDNRRG